MRNIGWRIEKRESTPKTLEYVVAIVSVALAFGVGAILLISYKVDLVKGYGAFFSGAFGSMYGITEILVKAIPLTLCGLAVMLPLRARLWNIGAEGQLYMGAFAAAIVGLYLPPDYPRYAFMVLSFAAALLMGGMWGLIPGILKARLGVNEIISTLMLNYVALHFIGYLVYGPLKDPHVFGFPLTPKIPDVARFARFFHSRLHSGIFIALAAIVFVYLLVDRTRFGYELRFVGANPDAAVAGGISHTKVVILAMLIGGALAGLAGMGEVAGVQFRLREGLSAGYGYSAIPVALLGKGNPIGVLGAAILFGSIYVGGAAMQQAAGIPVAIVDVIQALIIVFLIAGNSALRYRIKRRASGIVGSGPSSQGDPL